MTGNRGFFVVIDGPSGVGKTTVTQYLQTQFAEQGESVVVAREPTDSPIGELARQGTHRFSGVTLACLVAADRYDHIATTIRPAVEAGQLVICDRYLSTSLGLQVGDGVPESMIWSLHRYADTPDLTVILVGPPALARQRSAARGTYSRFQEGGEQAGIEEAERYRVVAHRLNLSGMPTIVYDIGALDGQQVATEIAAEITRMRADLAADDS